MLSEARLRANKRYQEQHKADAYRNQTKSKCKKFIRDFATDSELIELKQMINGKLNKRDVRR